MSPPEKNWLTLCGPTMLNRRLTGCGIQRSLVSLNLEGFGLQNQQSLDGKRFYMDAGESRRAALATKFSMRSLRSSMRNGPI